MMWRPPLRPAPSMTFVPGGNIDWAVSQLRAQLGKSAAIVAQPIDSRLGELHRIEAVVGPTRRTYYLKKYALASAGVTWSEHITGLGTVAGALDGVPGLLPYTVIASDSIRQTILVAEMPGRPLIALHRAAILSLRGRRDSIVAWRGVGRWLGRLHRFSEQKVSGEWALGLAEDITVRLRQWQQHDRGHAPLVDRAVSLTALVARQLAARELTLALCHVDVTVGNILVHGESVGFIDYDDLRSDMPGTDVSQAELEIEEFSRAGSVVPIPFLKRQVLGAFRDGYGEPYPTGAELWLPRLRTWAVVLLTMSRAPKPGGPAGIAARRRYLRTIAELRRSLSDGWLKQRPGRPGS